MGKYYILKNSAICGEKYWGVYLREDIYYEQNGMRFTLASRKTTRNTKM